MYVIYKTEHGKDSKASKPTFIPGQYKSREAAQEDMAYYARQAFVEALVKSQQLSEKFGPLVEVSLDVDQVEILEASLLKAQTVDIEGVTEVEQENTAQDTVGEMEGSVDLVDSTEQKDLESTSISEESEDDEAEEKEGKRDLNSQLICNHAMIYRNDAETSIDVIRLTEKRERHYIFFTKVVHVPEALVSFVVAEVPAVEDAEEEEEREEGEILEASQAVLDTFETNRSTLLTSLIEYDV